MKSGGILLSVIIVMLNSLEIVRVDEISCGKALTHYDAVIRRGMFGSFL